MWQFLTFLLPPVKAFVVCLVFVLIARPVAAAPSISITSLPSTLVAGQSFTVAASASSLIANAAYYTKIRLGTSTDALNKGQTNNSLNDSPDDWLGDSDSWSKFPQITADSSGNWSGNIVGRPSDTAVIGSNVVTVRMRKTDGSTNYDSSTSSVFVDPAPTSTPTPTLTPTPTSTPTPQATATPTSVPTPTKTPTPTPIKTPTQTPTKIPSPTPTEIPEDTPEVTPMVLGESVVNDESSPSAYTQNNSWRPMVISLLLVATGLAILAGFYTWNIARQKYLSDILDK